MLCHLRGRQLYNNEEMRSAVREFLRMQVAYFNLDEVFELAPCWNRYIIVPQGLYLKLTNEFSFT